MHRVMRLWEGMMEKTARGAWLSETVLKRVEPWTDCEQSRTAFKCSL